MIKDTLDYQIENAQRAAEKLAEQKRLEEQASQLESLLKQRAKEGERLELRQQLDQAIAMAQTELPALAGKVEQWKLKVAELDRLLGEVTAEQNSLHDQISILGDEVNRACFAYNTSFYTVPSPYTGRTNAGEFTGGVSQPAKLQEAGFDNPKLRIHLQENEASFQLRSLLQSGRRFFHGLRSLY